jgi:hypothetical membrane protein
MGDRGWARALLTGGVIGPVLFVVVFMIEDWTRPGYDPTTMFVSLLSLSDQGWQQVANFLVGGLLILGGAVGLRMVLRDGPGSRWGPILIGLTAVGLILAGIFGTDPGFGYPPGTPPGRRESQSMSETIHVSASFMAFFGLAAAMFVMARRFAGEGSRWALYSRLSAVGEIVFLFASIAFLDVAGVLQRISILLTLGWVAQVMWRFHREAVA